MSSRRDSFDLYGEPPLLREWRLRVDGGHELQVREWGSAAGIPALVLHGGPGSGCSPLLARFFDPARFRVIGMDQRGAGASLPSGGTLHNTTTDLLADLRCLRRALGVTRWLVVGGSWGATLALLHAIDAPEAVAGLLLRGLFLARAQDLASFFEPHGWAHWQPSVGSLVDRLDQSLHFGAPAEQAQLVRHWWAWEQKMDSAPAAAEPPLDALLQRYRIQAHYLRHSCWLTEPPLLDRLHRVPAVPLRMLHGSGDRICPIAGARAAAARLPLAQWIEVSGAGHSPTHPAMVSAMVSSLDNWSRSGRFDGHVDEDLKDSAEP